MITHSSFSGSGGGWGMHKESSQSLRWAVECKVVEEGDNSSSQRDELVQSEDGLRANEREAHAQESKCLE